MPSGVAIGVSKAACHVARAGVHRRRRRDGCERAVHDGHEQRLRAAGRVCNAAEHRNGTLVRTGKRPRRHFAVRAPVRRHRAALQHLHRNFRAAAAARFQSCAVLGSRGALTQPLVELQLAPRTRLLAHAERALFGGGGDGIAAEAEPGEARQMQQLLQRELLRHTDRAYDHGG